MVKKTLLLITLSFSLAIGSIWVLKAQDPKPVRPDNPAVPAQTPAEKPAQTPATTTEQIDLSGTYMGTFQCESAGLVGDTTLTITGNEFTTADGKKGRITASKTRGYTSVALQVNGADPSAPSAIISLRAKKSKDKLTLMPIAGSTQQCTFTPAKNVAKSKVTPAATGTEVAAPATPVQTPSPTPEASPTPKPSPTPAPPPSPTPAPSPSPGEPTPTPSPSPSPSPRMV